MKIEKLEAIRGFAALYVVIHHFIGYTVLKTNLPALVRLPFRAGQEAVIVFFLLSGFVICLSSHRGSHMSFKTYFLKRAVRIYPIAIAAFILSTIVIIFNQDKLSLFDLKSLVGNILMLQDTGNKPGLIFQTFLGNLPLWSLSYEWWFYMMFYPIYFLLVRRQVFNINSSFLALFISIAGWLTYISYPNHISLIMTYFSLWWSGVACAELYLQEATFKFKSLLPVILCLTIMSTLAAIPVLKSYLLNKDLSIIMYPLLSLRHYGFALFIILFGLIWWNAKLKYFDFIFEWFKKIAPISYAIYIIHFPIILLKIPTLSNLYIVILIKIILTVLISYILEVKYQPLITTMFLGKRRQKIESIEPVTA
jgi:peptidoglycan/LPS O-acetylase OafA/YrhL